MKRTVHKLTEQQKNEQIRRAFLFRALASTGSPISSRLSYGNTTTFNGLRDVYEALGYPKIDGIKFSDYYFRYRRQDIAGAIVEKPVEGSWDKLPIVHTNEEDSEKDPFREEWEAFEKKHSLYRMFQRADRVARIGSYGVLLLGFNDNAEFNQPVTKASDLLYLQPFTKDNAPIKQFVEDKNDIRYGLPLTYGLNISNTPGQQSSMEQVVHWSRVIHIAENLLESNIEGVPCLERPFNRMLNLELLLGGSAEMFWQGAFPGLAFIAKDDADLTAIAADMEDEIKKYTHQLERYMKLQGIDVKQLNSAAVDPTAHVDAQLKMISICTKIPKRILEGSERGELSSGQDADAWDDECDRRRKNHIEPTIIRAFIDRLNQVGVLKVPEVGYNVEWPPMRTQTEEERANTGKSVAEALSKYFSVPEAQLSMTFHSFLVEVLGYDKEKADRVVKSAEEIVVKSVEDDGQDDDEIDELEIGDEQNA